MGEYRRPLCKETVVGPLHHFSVKGWGRQQQHKEAGIDHVYVEQPRTRSSQMVTLNAKRMFTENQILKVWRQSKLIAILKLGKDLYPLYATCINCMNVLS